MDINSPAAISFVLQQNVKRYPHWQIEDLYKLLHQAALGSEHAVQDEVGVREWMRRELIEMGTGPADPEIDPISHNGRIARVHLRPYVAAGKDLQQLLLAFIQTANAFKGSVDTLSSYWQQAEDLAVAGQLPFKPEDLQILFNKMKAQGFPAMHHSAAYESQYHPAYRVVCIDYLV
jgi:hypothetical protein